jgi:glycosyltransferase 2 family protein
MGAIVSRRRLRGIIQILISAVLLTLILRQVRWAEVWDALRRIDVRWLAVAWALFLSGVVVRAMRWQVLLDALGVHRPLRELTTWYFVGSFFNVILPTGFGGDVVRAAELSQDTQRPGPVVNSVVVDRYLGIMVLLAMGLVAALVLPGTAPGGITAFTAALFAGGLAVAWLLRRPWWAGLGRREDLAGKAVRLLRLPALAEAVAPYDRRAMGRGLAASLGFNLIQIGWNVAIGWSLGLRLPLSAYFVFVPLTAVALLLPAFGGLGVREMSYVGLFGSAGVAQPVALALSLGVYIITVATGLVGGLLYLAGGVGRIRKKVE